MIFPLRRCHTATAVLCALTLTGVAVAAAADGDEIVARVNGAIISRKSVREVVLALAGAQDAPPSSEQVEQFTRDAVDSLIGFELLYQESQRRGISVGAGELDAAMEISKARFPSADTYKEALAQRGMSFDDVRRETEKALAVRRLLEQTAWRDLSIPPEQVRRFYDENREQFKHPAEIRASQILIRAGREASDERGRAKQRAKDLLAQLAAGADFADLARKYSQDAATAAKGGDLGFFGRGSMDPAFEDAAFALKPGASAKVVETQYGFHVLRVTDRRPAGHTPLAEAEDEIKTVLGEEEKRRRQDQLVAELKKPAKIEILPEPRSMDE